MFDSLPTIHSDPSSPRAITPSKQRSVTPETRSASANARLRASLQKAVFEAQTCNASLPRCPSRRKQRRWENMNIYIDLHKIQDQEQELELDDNEASFGIHFDWRSELSKLFEKENSVELELFRACVILPGPVNEQTTKRASRNDEWAIADQLWVHRVEKRLRTIVSKALCENVEHCIFLHAVSIVLMYFCEKKTVPPMSVIPSALSTQLQKGLKITSSSNELVIPLKDSSFHRLLVHAGCQFYGLISKSINSVRQKCRVTRVTLPHRLSTESHSISLVAFILASAPGNSSAQAAHIFDEGSATGEISELVSDLHISPTVENEGEISPEIP